MLHIYTLLLAIYVTKAYWISPFSLFQEYEPIITSLSPFFFLKM